MRGSRTLLLLALPLCLAAATPAHADDEVRSEAGSWPALDARRVVVDMGVGELRVRPADGDAVEAHLSVTCDRDTRACREAASHIHVRPRRAGSSVELEVVGQKDRRGGHNLPTPHLELRVPRGLALRAELGVGEVDVRGLEGDVEVEAGVGEVRVEVAEAAVRSVRLDVGVGEARLTPRPEAVRSRGFLFLGDEVDWDEGTGTAEVSVEVGVGEASVKLVP